MTFQHRHENKSCSACQEWVKEWDERVRWECESVRVTFEHRDENKSCSACQEWFNERLKECESEKEWDSEREWEWE